MSGNENITTSKNHEKSLTQCEKTKEKEQGIYNLYNFERVFVCNLETRVVYIRKQKRRDKNNTNNINQTAMNTSITNQDVDDDEVKIIDDGVSEKKYTPSEKEVNELRKHEVKLDKGQKMNPTIERKRKQTSIKIEENKNNTTEANVLSNTSDNKRVRNNDMNNSDDVKRKRQPFIYDIELEISFDGEKLQYMTPVIKSVIDIIMGNIIYNYHPWRIAAREIAMHLYVKLLNAYINEQAKCPKFKWRTSVHISGYCPGNDEQININEDLPVVYDCFSYIGYLKPEKSQYILNPENYSMILNYTIKFFLNPAVEVAKSFYEAKGFPFQVLKPNSKRKFAFDNHDFIINSNSYDYKKMYNDSLTLMFIEEQKCLKERNRNK